MYTLAELKKEFTNEQVFIILLVRLYLDTVTKKEVQDFLQSQVIDYIRVYKIAGVHNVRPILFHVISTSGLEVHSDLAVPLKNFYVQNQLRSMEQLTICDSVVKELNAEGISAIPFKGTVFSQSYFGNLGLRESTDIDLLVESGDVELIEQYFKDKKFKAKVAVPAGYLDYYRKYFKEIVYTAPAKSSNTYSIEIHWKPLNYYFGPYPGFKFFEKGLTEIKLGEVKMPALQPTYDFLAVASNHFVKDMSVKFKYLADIACLIHKSGHLLDLGLIEQVLEDNHCRKRVEHGLFRVEKLLGKRIAALNTRYYFNEKSLSTSLQVPLLIGDFNVTNPSFILRSLRLQDNSRQKIKFLMRCTYYFLLPTDNDLNTTRSANMPVILLAILRPFRLIFKVLLKSSGRK